MTVSRRAPRGSARPILLLGALWTALAVPPTALAQDPPEPRVEPAPEYRQQIGLGGGAFFTGEFEIGPDVQLQVLGPVKDGWRYAIGLRYRMAERRLADVDDVTSHIATAFGGLHYRFLDEGVVPYVGATAGLSFAFFGDDELEELRDPTESFTFGATLTPLVGVEVPVMKRWVVFGEAGLVMDLQVVLTRDEEAELDYGSSVIGGVRYRF